MSAQASGLRRRFALQCAVLPAQVVVTLEKLRLRIERRPTFGETARLTMQGHDVLSNRPIEPFQQRGRDWLERDQFFDAEHDPSGDGDQTPPRPLFDHLPVAHSRVRYDLRIFRAARPLALEEVDQDGEDHCQREQVGLPTVRGPQGPAISSESPGRAFDQFRRRLLRARADDHFQHQAGLAGHCDVRPMLADFFQVTLLLVRMLLAGEAVEFIQFDILRRNACDNLPVGGFGLQAGALDPPSDGGRMDAFDASDGFRAKPFEPLLNGALDFRFRGLEIIEGCAVAVAECFPTAPAADHIDGLAAPDRIATVIS